ncbi:MAG: hypothetical protein ACM37W_05320 [Actinomycetota bacterium]
MKTLEPTISNSRASSRSSKNWWSKFSASIALLNLLLVLFNSTYIPLRPIYFRYVPRLVTVYDPIKGVESNTSSASVLTITDGFWQIDRFFICFFAIELLVQAFLLRFRKPGKVWTDTLLRRWYEVFLLIPFWREFRMLPVLVRLHKSGLINLDRVVDQIIAEPTLYLANTLSEYIIVRLINQAKKSLQQGEAARFLLQPQPYLHVNQSNTIEQILNRLLDLTIYKVLPQVQPNLEAVVHHNLERAIKQSDFYQMMAGFSPMGLVPTEVTEQLANYLAKTAVNVVATAYEDDRGRELIESLTQDFKETLRQELQDQNTLLELQLLLADLLEEFKLNYIQGGLKIGSADTLAEIDRLRQAVE